jgi:serine/threonine-protein kinase HipA
VTFAYQPGGGWTASHQMTVAGKRDGFTRADLRACARTASMRRGRAEAILGHVQRTVARWRDFADEAGVAPAHRDRIQSTLRLEPFPE